MMPPAELGASPAACPDAATLRALYDSGMSLRALAARYGWSYRTARQRVLASGATLRPRGVPPQPVVITAADRQQVQRLIAAVGVRRVAQVLHLDADLVHVLGSAWDPAAPSAAQVLAVARGVAQGTTIAALARELGCSPRTIARLLRRARVWGVDHSAAELAAPDHGAE